MKISYSETTEPTADAVATLQSYREDLQSITEGADFSKPESALITWKDENMLKNMRGIAAELGEVEHVIVIGIGGSSLGTEAIHAALGGSKTLHVLDSVAPYRIREVVESLATVPVDDIAVCAISKSGGTTETLTNTAVLFDELRELYGERPFSRMVCIGNEHNALLTAGAQSGAYTLAMPEAIGGRYSVFTSVGLMPLLLLGHDIDAILDGVTDVFAEQNESIARTGALSLFEYLKSGVVSVNFFAFDTRLEKLGRWYRQLTAESLGKEHTIDGKEVEVGFVPTISTPVELHSIGQLYFSGFENVFTDFVTFEDKNGDYTVSNETQLAEGLTGKSMKQIHEAIYGGVIAAYTERNLPYRTTMFEKELPYSLGLFMAIRMLETMYLAKLLQVNAFDQPNVELYKTKTKEILGL